MSKICISSYNEYVFTLLLYLLVGYVSSVPDEPDSCAFETCEECQAHNCSWVLCPPQAEECFLKPVEFCSLFELCAVTTVPSNGTTVTEAVMTHSDNFTTTEVPETTTVITTEVPTTTEQPTPVPPHPTTTSPAETTTKEPDVPTTIVPTTNGTTTQAPLTTTAPPPQGHHFDTASFFGGMLFMLILMILAFAGWRFYTRRYAIRYNNLL